MPVLNFSSLCRSNLCYSKIFSRTKFTKTFTKPINSARKIPKHYKKPLFEREPIVLPPRTPVIPKQKFDYFLVLDIEATCDYPDNVEPQEIIEFPVIKVNAETFIPEATFHSYVRPFVVPRLSTFCTELTGIIQEMIDQQPDFEVVFQNFLAWLEKEQVLKPGVKFAFVTCSDPDLEYFFPLQCKISEIEVPDFMKRWINVKRSFCDIPPYTYPANLTTMMKWCDITPEGELHSGIDDALNLVKVLKDLAQRGLVFDFNGSKE
ncbi:ERI1 exoribonuclease 3-like [Argiope bruennichi]|uniref:ERI1 exoribonuclease 3 like protein n=1 Tax=Argiope bruennichi TaxID=94029 RepID=A0A8T0F9W9_ARGBR|nr:ERI1 exoribonuclease 3-like [Argiope bruennichi]KAF8786170.1 ERI1 exoribonuclease 3 like protein [Argiope bruennichi]